MAKGDGSIQQVSRGKWRVSVSFGKDPVTGKYQRATRTVSGTKADARKVRDQLVREHEGGLRVDAGKVTFGEFARQWADNRVAMGEIGERQRDVDDYMVRLLSGYIGGVRLADITPAAVESLYAKVKADRGLSGTTMNKVHQMLKQMLASAVSLDIIMRNPCDRVKAPRKEEPERRALTVEEGARLLAAVDAAWDAELAALNERQRRQTERGNLFGRESIQGLGVLGLIVGTRIALATGMRMGEVLALTWDGIDLAGSRVNVTHSMTQKGTRKPPKTKAGVRSVAVDGATCERLAAWRWLQASELRKLGISQDGSTPVCCSRVGTFANQNNYERWWRSFREEAGFPGLKFHELRHTQATQLLANGVDVKTVQARMGHSNASITLNWYAHALPENDERAARIIGGLFSEAPKETEQPRVVAFKTA